VARSSASWMAGNMDAGLRRRGQSVREGEGVRNEARGECGALARLKEIVYPQNQGVTNCSRKL
jgi:hypothetical protein